MRDLRKLAATAYRRTAPPGHFPSTAAEGVIESPQDWLRRRVNDVCVEGLREVA